MSNVNEFKGKYSGARLITKTTGIMLGLDVMQKVWAKKKR